MLDQRKILPTFDHQTYVVPTTDSNGCAEVATKRLMDVIWFVADLTRQITSMVRFMARAEVEPKMMYAVCVYIGSRPSTCSQCINI